jgi:hypothetical protein
VGEGVDGDELAAAEVVHVLATRCSGFVARAGPVDEDDEGSPSIDASSPGGNREKGSAKLAVCVSR